MHIEIIDILSSVAVVVLLSFILGFIVGRVWD